MKLLHAVTTISSYTGLSRILGLVREILMSHVLGASIVTDAFVVAFKFPNFFRRLFAEGALHAAFVPTFSGNLVKNGHAHARQTAEHVFAVLAGFLVLFVTIVLVFTPQLIPLLAPGFASTPEALQLAVDFTRLTFPYILFISLAALMTGVLNSLDRFAAGAFAPALLNIIMIGALLSYSVFHLMPGYTLAASVLVAGVAQFLWLYCACWRAGIRLRIQWPRLHPDVREVTRLMLPGAFGAGIMQVNLFIDMWLASFLPVGSLSYLYYADRLNQLPLSIFGIAIGTALLPKLSRLLQNNEKDEALKTQESAIEIALQLSIPSAVGLIVLAYPIISLIYGHGKFGEAQINATAPTLAAFALGLPAYVLAKVLTANFFAHRDTRTPAKVGLVTVGINIGLNLVLMGPFLYVGMALATSLAAWCNVLMLVMILKRQQALTWSSHLWMVTLKITIVSLLMGVSAWAFHRHFSPSPSLWREIFHLILMILLSCGIFVFLGHWSKAFNIRHLKQAMRKT